MKYVKIDFKMNLYLNETPQGKLDDCMVFARGTVKEETETESDGDTFKKYLAVDDLQFEVFDKRLFSIKKYLKWMHEGVYSLIEDEARKRLKQAAK